MFLLCLQLLTTALVPSIASAEPLSAPHLARDKPTCHEFAHDPSSSWNFTGRLPTQRLAPAVNCIGNTVSCPINSSSLVAAKIGWKYYWDAPPDINLGLSDYDPAKTLGQGVNEVVIDTSDTSETVAFGVPAGKVGAIGVYVGSVIRVPGTFKGCDNGVEYAGAVTLPQNGWATWTLVVSDADGNWLPETSQDQEGSAASIMTEDEAKGRPASNRSGSPRSACLDAPLVALPLVIAFLSLVVL